MSLEDSSTETSLGSLGYYAHDENVHRVLRSDLQPYDLRQNPSSTG